MTDIRKLWKEKIIPCKNCEISNLTGNCDKAVWGGNEEPSDYFWIAQNPGYVDRNKTHDWDNDKLRRVFPIEGNNNKQQDEFTKFLFDKGIYQKSYFTNLIKCATLKNRAPDRDEIKKCFNFLLDELILIKPKKIITLGKVSREWIEFYQEKIKEILDNPLMIHYPHPTYVYSYNRSKKDEFENQVLKDLL